MHELICLGWSFCLYRLLTLKNIPALSFGSEIKILFGYGIWYSIISIVFILISYLLK